MLQSPSQNIFIPNYSCSTKYNKIKLTDISYLPDRQILDKLDNHLLLKGHHQLTVRLVHVGSHLGTMTAFKPKSIHRNLEFLFLPSPVIYCRQFQHLQSTLSLPQSLLSTQKQSMPPPPQHLLHPFPDHQLNILQFVAVMIFSHLFSGLHQAGDVKVRLIQANRQEV